MDNALRMERPGISTRTDLLGFPSGKIRGEAEPKVKIVSACQNASRTGSTQSIGWDRTTHFPAKRETVQADLKLSAADSV